MLIGPWAMRLNFCTRCVKLKQSDRLSERNSVGVPILGRPNVASMKFRIEPNSCCTCETYPTLANGDMTSSGTRKPRPCESSCGGTTWSYQPPQSSHTTIIAVLDQHGLAPMAL